MKAAVFDFKCIYKEKYAIIIIMSEWTQNVSEIWLYFSRKFKYSSIFILGNIFLTYPKYFSLKSFLNKLNLYSYSEFIVVLIYLQFLEIHI